MGPDGRAPGWPGCARTACDHGAGAPGALLGGALRFWALPRNGGVWKGGRVGRAPGDGAPDVCSEPIDWLGRMAGGARGASVTMVPAGGSEGRGAEADDAEAGAADGGTPGAAPGLACMYGGRLVCEDGTPVEGAVRRSPPAGTMTGPVPAAPGTIAGAAPTRLEPAGFVSTPRGGAAFPGALD